jgi:hypothetical protein
MLNYHFVHYESYMKPQVSELDLLGDKPASSRMRRSRGSVVGIATGYRLDGRGVGVRVPVGLRIFFSPSRPDRLWGPPNLLSNGYRGALSSWVKRPGLEVGQSHAASADVKKMWIYTSTPPYAFMAECLIR